ncbi:ion transporter [Burkholderia pseudomallei]|nr:ion transporter [Burkholderia pseudomallei]MBF3406575.1 ion transporter [Burkholderia pseudomallei]MBF3410421.1 ion transporter [Burkholderia pseudomallei]MBF3575740.1 ion transporter [Burkholderia pseudomallei]MBF3619921.1 ion transporter [Burkholderia pseudomallei]
MRLAQLRRDLSDGVLLLFFAVGGAFCRLFGVCRGWPVMSAVGWRRPSPGRGSLFFVLPKKSHQKKGASLGGRQRERRLRFSPASAFDSRQTTLSCHAHRAWRMSADHRTGIRTRAPRPP